MIEPGKLPPQAIDFEDAVIGALLIEPHSLPSVTPFLKKECFYKEDNGIIYEAILSLNSLNTPIDLLSVCQHLKKTNQLERVGGAHGVSVKTNRIATAANIEHHAAIIYQMYVLRDVIRISNKYTGLANEPQADGIELVGNMLKELKDVDFIGRSAFRVIGDEVADIIKDLRHAITEGIPSGLQTGFVALDQHFNKQKQDFGVIAARPGMGKTAFMLQLAKNTAVIYKKPVAIFSLEMSTRKLVGRLMASESNVSSQHINEKRITSGELMSLGAGVEKLLDAPIYIDDTASLDITLLRSKIRKMIQSYGVEEVYIDYLQLMAGERKGNREQEISYISRNLKLIAKEENVPIIALSQLSRTVEARTDKKPILSDLRESGAIEQDADWVFFLMRPEYYNLENQATGLYEGQTFAGRHLSQNGLLVVDCAKYREGSLFVAPLLFEGKYMRIEDHPSVASIGETFNPLENNNDFLQ